MMRVMLVMYSTFIERRRGIDTRSLVVKVLAKAQGEEDLLLCLTFQKELLLTLA
jgi:hypothetical protein